MPYPRTLCLPLLLLLMSSNAFAEGFAMTEWSARGLSLAGGLVARADDASAVAYNPAGITQLPGVRLMTGISLISPRSQIETREEGVTRTHNIHPAVFYPPHLYATWQFSDDWWLGFGVFSRFGLGNQYASDWPGRYAIHNIGLQTLSANPVIAYKANDWLSLAAGVELMRLTIFLENKIPPVRSRGLPENNLNLQGDSWGVGMNAAAHIRFNEQWSAGLSYRSQMTHHVTGRARFDLKVPGSQFMNANANATVQLPDSAALAVMWKPLPNLSFEAGAVWTRWSTYNALNIYSDAGLRSIKQTSFRDGWNFNAGVEYSPLEWLTLRLGYWHETPVVNETYADYILPTNGRDCLTTGVGFKWNNWTLDLAYAHLWIYPLNYDTAASGNPQNVRGVLAGAGKNGHADIVSVSLGYAF